MIKSIDETDESIFIASLPHKQSFYKQSGWNQSQGPRHSDWKHFLSNNFSPLEIEFARSEVKRCRSFIKTRRFDFKAISIWDDNYPELLREIFDPPPILFLQGDPLPTISNSLAIVGTRDPAPVALAAVDEFMLKIADQQKEHTIISGFARGIDARAHKSAIKYRLPGVAVLGSGLCYAGPTGSRILLEMARKEQVPFTLLTEFPPHIPGYAGNFPRRNRIIAGLAWLVAIFQAPFKSGALITARFAADEGREVAFFDHHLLQGTGFNEGARAMLESGAPLILLKDLEKRIIREPTFKKEPEPEQYEFWEKRRLGQLIWLGSQFYLRKRGNRG